eukprot:scaffold4621_cov128-Isochrysis_galbana.AAC.12
MSDVCMCAWKAAGWSQVPGHDCALKKQNLSFSFQKSFHAPAGSSRRLQPTSPQLCNISASPYLWEISAPADVSSLQPTADS